MADVPFNPLQSVLPDSRAPAPEYTPEMFGAGAGRALQGGAQQGLDYAQKQQALNDDAEAKDADVAYQRALNDLGFGAENGYFSQLGKKSLDAYAPTQQQAADAREAIASNIQSPRARAAFDRAASVHLMNFTESMSRHNQQQRKLWLVGSSDARANETIAIAANYWNDPKRFAQAVATARDEAFQQGDLQGWSDEQKQAQARAYESKAWVLRISKMSQTNPMGAQDLFNENAAALDPVAAVQLSATLKQSVIPVQTRALADAVMQGTQTPSANLVDAVVQAESGGRRFAPDGKILEGPATAKGTAKGEMQVLDSTNASPGFGVIPAKDDTPAERARVGRDYLQAMLQRYGNQSMALAAYNWGPAKVDGLIAKGIDPRMGGAAEQRFVDALPAETQAYIAKINKSAPPTPGSAPTERDINSHLAGWMAQVKESAKAMWPDDPAAQDAAVAQLVQSVGVINTGNAATERASIEGLMNATLGFQSIAGNVTQLPADQRPKTLSELMQRPGAQDAWNAADPEKKRGILALLEQNAKGENPTWTDKAFKKYYALIGMQQNDPEAFLRVNMTDAELLRTLPQQATLSLMAQQKAMSSKQERDIRRGANVTQAISMAKQMGLLRGAGIDPNAKPGSADADRFDQFTGRLTEALDQFLQSEKKAPTQKEQRAIVTRLLSEGYQTNASRYVFWSKPERLFEATDLKTWRAKVPAEMHQPLFDALKAQIGRDPSDQEMDDAWTVRVRQMGSVK